MDKIQDSGSCDRRSIRLGGTKGIDIGVRPPFSRRTGCNDVFARATSARGRDIEAQAEKASLSAKQGAAGRKIAVGFFVRSHEQCHAHAR